MPWDKTPWWIGNGAIHSPEVMRNLAYQTLAGNEGITAPGDLKVLAASPAGTTLRVMPGSAALLNRSVDSAGGQQLYTGRMPSLDTISPTATGSSSGRSDAIIARVEDPTTGQWGANPADPTTAQYIFTRQIQNVSPTLRRITELNLNYPAILLARHDIPANVATAFGVNSTIVDLRELAQPRRDNDAVVSGSFATPQGLSASTLARWFTPASFQVRVPYWATHYIVELEVRHAIHESLAGTTTSVNGIIACYMDGALVASAPYASITPVGTSVRIPIMSAITNGALAVPTGKADTLVTFELYGRRDGGTSALTTDAQTRAVLKYTWLQRPV